MASQAARYGLCFAYWLAGRLRECLATAQQGLELAQGDLCLGADYVGFSPSLGCSFFHGFVLSLTGRPRDAAGEFDRAISLARASQQLALVWIGHSYQVLRCEVTGEAAPALAHARESLDYAERTGRIVGFKAAGGVSTSKAALHRLVLVKETLGDDWLTPDRIRIGASSVLNDLLMQYARTETGRYGRSEDFSKE